MTPSALGSETPPVQLGPGVPAAPEQKIQGPWEMGAVAEGPGRSPSWARRKFSAPPPCSAFPPPGHAAQTGEKAKRDLSSWQNLGLQSQLDLGANPSPAVGTRASDLASLSFITLICHIGGWDTSPKSTH